VPERRKHRNGLAAKVQNNLASMLQDLFWLINARNQVEINDSLNHFIREQVPAGNKVVLYGYSGGAIIDFNYLLSQLPYIDLYPSAKANKTLPTEVVEQLNDREIRHTCLQAVLDNQLGQFDHQAQLTLFPNDSEWTSQENQIRYLNELLPALKKANQSTCLPADRLKGVVTFGSPIAALTARSLNASQGNLYLQLSRFLVEHNIFWVNLNRLNDPLGYSLPVSAIEDQLLRQYQLNLYGKDRGFIYSNILFQNRVFFYNAHLWYLKNSQLFSKAIVNNLKSGYEQHLHPPGVQPDHDYSP
jgi:hypothetical protein